MECKNKQKKRPPKIKNYFISDVEKSVTYRNNAETDKNSKAETTNASQSENMFSVRPFREGYFRGCSHGVWNLYIHVNNSYLSLRVKVIFVMRASH